MTDEKVSASVNVALKSKKYHMHTPHISKWVRTDHSKGKHKFFWNLLYLVFVKSTNLQFVAL